jgi:hypothetical protein
VTIRPVRASAWLTVVLGPIAVGRLALSADPQPPEAPSTALVRLSKSVATQLSGASAEPPLAVYVGASSDLARSFATVLISELAARSLAPLAISAPSTDAAEASARSGGARSLVRLQVALSNGLVEARGDLISTWVNFWSGQSGARSGRPAAAIYASVEADAQALALAAAKVPTAKAAELQLEMAKLADLPAWTGALAAGDLNGDGKDEIVALTNDEILAFSWDGRLLARRDHRALGDSPAPCREPFGAISIQSQRIAYFSAARRKGEVLTLDGARGEFRSLGPLSEVPVAALGQTQIWGSFVAGRSAFAPELWSAAGERWAVPGPFWMLSFFSAATGPRVLMAFADGTASWGAGLGDLRPRIIGNAAAAMSLIDVDGDGEPEFVTTSSRYRPEPDELRVLSAPAQKPTSSESTLGRAAASVDGGVANQELWRGTIQGGWALQLVGARAGAGQPEQIVVAVWMPDGAAQLRVFRRVAP